MALITLNSRVELLRDEIKIRLEEFLRTEEIKKKKKRTEEINLNQLKQLKKLIKPSQKIVF